jgi:hypothetical protein
LWQPGMPAASLDQQAMLVGSLPPIILRISSSGMIFRR